jgi:hypothetical protein
MTEIQSAVEQAYLNKIENATSYSGSTGGERIISASSVFSDDLPLYLKIKHGGSKKWSYGQSSIGTIMHIGMDHVFKDHICSQRLNLPINDKWTLSGEFDLLMDIDVDGKKYHCIIDHKLTTYKTVTKVEKDREKHEYSSQLRVYKYLLTQLYPEMYTSDNTLMFLAVSVKDGTRFTKPIIPDFEMVQILNDMPDDELLQKIKDKADRLQAHLDSNNEPEQCSVLFWNYASGKTNKYGKKIPEPEKCLSYCDYVDVCSHGKRFKAKKDRSSILNLVRI